MQRISLAVVQKRARKVVESLLASGLDPDDFCSFFWSSPLHDVEQEITQDDFFSAECPPGTYRFVFRDDKEEVKFEGDKYDLRLDVPETGGNALANITKATSILLRDCSAESERAHRRLREEEARADSERTRADGLQQSCREKDRQIALLEAKIDELESDDDVDRLGEILRDVIVRWLGIDGDTGDEQAQAFQTVLEVIRKSADVQHAFVLAGAGESLRLLGIGSESGGTP